MLAATVQALRALRRDGRGAEADAVGTLARQQQVGGTEEGGDETRRGLRIQVVRMPDFEQAAVIHDPDGVGQREGLFLVVRHQHGGDAELALHRADGAAKLFADLRVQRAERLIEQQHLGLVRQRARHGHALLLAAGKLARQAFVHVLERHELEQLLAPGAPIGRLHAPHAQCEFDVVRHGHVAEQRVILENQPHATIACPYVGHVAPMQRNAAVIDAGQPRDGPQQGTLAASPKGPAGRRIRPSSISMETSLTTG